MKKAILALALAVAVGVVGASQLLASSSKHATATTWIVDQGTKQCNATGNLAAYKSADAIQNAVTAASAGDTIDVCPGKYNPFTVDKRLTITGTSVTATTAAQCIAPGTYPATDQTKYAIVDGGGTTNAITVDGTEGVKINSLTIQNAPYGIHADTSTNGVVVQTSVIQNNQNGVRLVGGIYDPNATPGDSDDVPSKIKSSCIRRNSLAAMGGNGILVDDDLNGAKIQSNTFYKNNNAGDGGGINITGGFNVMNLQITLNTGNADANFVSATDTTGLIINGNSTTGILGGAVWLDGNNDDAQVTANTFINGHDDGIAFGDNGVGATNDHVLVFGNKVTGNATDGIDTSTDAALAGSEIGNNIVQTNGDHGIELANTGNTYNFITGNTVSGNGVVSADNCFDTDKVGNHDTWFGNTTPDCKP